MTAAKAAAGRGHLLLVDDDPVFREVLAAALTRRDYTVTTAADLASARCLAASMQPAWAVIDLKLPDGSGLELVAELASLVSGLRMLVLTGYASIATAVEAVKLGAVNYLPKPATADEIVAALEQTEADPERSLATAPPSVDRLQWEHIQRVLAAHDGNISATARALNMHRRTLQRKLAKRPVKR